MSEKKSRENGRKLERSLWVIVRYAVILIVVLGAGREIYNKDIYSKCLRVRAGKNVAEAAGFEPYINWGVVDEEAIYATEAAMKFNELGVAMPQRPDSIGAFLFIEILSPDDRKVVKMVHKSSECKNITSVVQPKPVSDFDGWIKSLALSHQEWEVSELVSGISYCEKCLEEEEERNYLSRIFLRDVVRINSKQYGVIQSRDNNTIRVEAFDW